LSILDYKEMHISIDNYIDGDLKNMLGIRMEREQKYIFMSPSSGFTYKVIRKDEKNDKNLTTQSEKKYKALMLRDSFAYAMTPFMSETIGEVEYIQSRNVRAIQDKVISYKPDIVILETVERYVSSLLQNAPPLKEVK